MESGASRAQRWKTPDGISRRPDWDDLCEQRAPILGIVQITGEKSVFDPVPENYHCKSMTWQIYFPQEQGHFRTRTGAIFCNNSGRNRACNHARSFRFTMSKSGPQYTSTALGRSARRTRNKTLADCGAEGKSSLRRNIFRRTKNISRAIRATRPRATMIVALGTPEAVGGSDVAPVTQHDAHRLKRP
jgi:hypothetical protein